MDLIGHKFNRLTVLEEATKRDNSTCAHWRCLCECGNQTTVTSHDLKYGHSKSCGCYRTEITAQRNKLSATHQHTVGGRISHEYIIWLGIKARCNDPKHTYYKYYGGKGINLFNEWINSFANFFAYIGKSPSIKHTIDRINNDGNYEPGNIRWATRKEQANNRTNTKWVHYMGQLKTVSQLADISGVSYNILRKRLDRGWDIEKAMQK